MRKIIISILMIIALSISLVACGDEKEDDMKPDGGYFGEGIQGPFTEPEPDWYIGKL